MKNLRDALREYTKRVKPMVIRRKHVEKKEETNVTTRPLDAQHNDHILENNAALLRKELSTRSNNDAFWTMFKGMDENEAASQNMFYEFYMKNRRHGWSNVTMRQRFEDYVQSIAVIHDITPRIKRKREETINYTNMAHQAYKGV